MVVTIPLPSEVVITVLQPFSGVGDTDPLGGGPLDAGALGAEPLGAALPPLDVWGCCDSHGTAEVIVTILSPLEVVRTVLHPPSGVEDAEPLGAGPLGAGPLDAGPLGAGPLGAGPLVDGEIDALGAILLEFGPFGVEPAGTELVSENGVGCCDSHGTAEVVVITSLPLEIVITVLHSSLGLDETNVLGYWLGVGKLGARALDSMLLGTSGVPGDVGC